MKALPWILLLLALVGLFWKIYFPPREDMTYHKEKEAFQDTIQVLRDSLELQRADIAVKSNRTDFTIAKIQKVAKEALRDRNQWRASYKAAKAKLDTLEGQDYQEHADSLLTATSQKIDTLYKKIEELTVSTEELTQQLKFERESREKAMELMQAQVKAFEERVGELDDDVVDLTKKNKRTCRALVVIGIVGFVGGLFVD